MISSRGKPLASNPSTLPDTAVTGAMAFQPVNDRHTADVTGVQNTIHSGKVLGDGIVKHAVRIRDDADPGQKPRISSHLPPYHGLSPRYS